MLQNELDSIKHELAIAVHERTLLRERCEEVICPTYSFSIQVDAYAFGLAVFRCNRPLQAIQNELSSKRQRKLTSNVSKLIDLGEFNPNPSVLAPSSIC